MRTARFLLPAQRTFSSPKRLRFALPRAIGLVAALGVFAALPEVPSADCDGNGVDDRIDLAEGTHPDCNANGIPDPCESAIQGVEFLPGPLRDLGLRNPPPPVVADLTGDGAADLIFSSGAQFPFAVYFNDGAGGFDLYRRFGRDGAFSYSYPVVADFDLDGDLDVAAIDWSKQFVLWENPGDGRLSSRPAPQVQLPLTSDGLSGGDVDGDGFPDLFVRISRSEVVVVWNNGPDGFEMGPEVHEGSLADDIVVSDIDNDGDGDLLIASQSGPSDGGVLVVRTEEGRSFAPAVQIDNTPARWLHAADLDLDGDLDILAGTGILENRGDGSFLPLVPMSYSSLKPALADMDGDGDPDIVATRSKESKTPPVHTVIYFNNGYGTFWEPVRVREPVMPYYVSAVDLDGDGDLDIGTTSARDPVFFQVLFRLETPLNRDCNGNGVPDDCDLESGELTDCDLDGNPDECAIAAGEVEDCNANGVPDACETTPPDELFEGPPILETPFEDLLLKRPETRPVSIVDLDRDGTPELVTHTVVWDRPAISFFTVWRRKPAGGFAPGPRVLKRQPSLRFEFADLNGDGAPDIVTSYGEVFRNTGDGVFPWPELLALPQSPLDVAAGDLDGDGAADAAFAVTSSQEDHGVLFRNDGSGDLVPWQTIPLEIKKVERVSAGDLNADGLIDLIFGGGSTRTAIQPVFVREGGVFEPAPPVEVPEAFGAPPFALTVRDLNGDSAVEVVFSTTSPAVILQNDGNGNLSPAYTLSEGGLTDFQFVDADNDGQLDLLGSGRTSAVFWNDGGRFSEAFTPFPSDHYDVRAAVGDLNGDSVPDAAVNVSRDQLGIYFGSGDRIFSRRLEVDLEGYTPAIRSPSMLAADFNGDGHLDIAATRAFPPAVVFLLAVGGRLPGRRVSVSLPSAPLRLAGGDLDGDGHSDVALRAYDSNALFLIFGAATGTFETVELEGVSTLGHIVTLDFDGDGDVDIVTDTHGAATGPAFYVNDGNRSFSLRIPAESEFAQYPLGGADFDGDGDDDLLLLNGDSRVYVLQNNGTPSPTPLPAVRIGIPLLIDLNAAVGDLDGDGDSDVILACGERAESAFTILTNSGAGTFRPVAGQAQCPYAAALLDIEGDGVAEIAAIYTRTSRLALLRWDRRNGITTIHEFGGLVTPRALLGIGLDGRPGTDIAVLQRPLAKIALFLNRLAPVLESDCDGDGVPDSCELEAADCNANGVLDACDIASGASADANEDGIPDECNGGFQFPGDCNGDTVTDISDAICILRTLFQGVPARFPCGDGSATHEANLALLDYQFDGRLNIADAVALLQFLFMAAPRPPLLDEGGAPVGCRFYADCPDNPLCP